MKRRAAGGGLQDREEKACSEKLLRLNARTYERYVNKEPSQDNDQVYQDKSEVDFIVKPAYWVSKLKVDLEYSILACENKS